MSGIRLRLLSGLCALALASGLACSSGSGTTSDTVELPDREPVGKQDTCELPTGQYQSGFDMVSSFDDLQARFPQVVIKTASSTVGPDEVSMTFDVEGDVSAIDPATLPPGEQVRFYTSFLAEPGGKFTDLWVESRPEGWVVLTRDGAGAPFVPAPTAALEIAGARLVVRIPTADMPPIPPDPIVLYTAIRAVNDSMWVRTTCPVR